MNPSTPQPPVSAGTQPSNAAPQSPQAEYVARLSEIVATSQNPRERAAKVAELKARYQKDVFGIIVKAEEH